MYMQHAACMQILIKHDSMIETLALQLWPAWSIYIYITYLINLCGHLLCQVSQQID